MLLALTPGTAGAAATNLTWDQVQEAVAHGRAAYEERKSQGLPIDDLEPGYVVDHGADVGRAMLFTEFSAVALETRRWLAIARDLKPEDIEQILKPLRGRLRFSVMLVGQQRDVLRHYTARLAQGGRTLAPASWEVFRASPQPGPLGFVAPAQYLFETKDLDLAAPVTLVLANRAGEELRFEFDLGRLR